MIAQDPRRASIGTEPARRAPGSTDVERLAGEGLSSGGTQPGRRGLAYGDGLPGIEVVQREPLTRAAARQLAQQGVSALKIDVGVPASTLVHLAEIDTLRRLDLSGCDLADADLAPLGGLPSLQALSLARCRRVGDGALVHLCTHQALEEINLQWTEAGDGAVALLAGKPALHRVSLGRQLTDRGVSLLHGLPALRTPGYPDAFLAVSSATRLTDQALVSIGGLAGLVALDLSFSLFGSQHYTARGVAQLAALSSLEELNFLGPLTTDAVLVEIARIPRLRTLSCQDMASGDDGFTALGGCSTLEVLWGRSCHGVTDRGFAALARLPRLRTLALGGQRLTARAMASLADAPALTELQPIQFGDAAFEFIARMPRLETLTNMINRDTTDVATRHLAGHARLRHYGAHGTQITDESLGLLADLPALESLVFENCDRITEEGLGQLARAGRLQRVTVASCPQLSDRWRASLPRIETSFEPAQSAYVDEYRFWTLLGFANVPAPEAPAVAGRAHLSAGDRLADALPLGCQAEWREDGLHLSVDGRRRVHRVGAITREPVRAPVRIDVMVRPIGEVHFYFGPGQLLFDEHGALDVPPWHVPLHPHQGQPHAAPAPDPSLRDAWRRITLRLDATEGQLFVDDVLRHTWQEDFRLWRSRVAIGPRVRALAVRDLRLTPLDGAR